MKRYTAYDLVSGLIKSEDLYEAYALGLNKRARGIHSQEDYKDSINDVIASDSIPSEEFFKSLRDNLQGHNDSIPQNERVTTVMSTASAIGVRVDKTLEGDDMKFKLYLTVSSFDNNFTKIEDGFSINVILESSTGFIQSHGWNLSRKSWKDFDKAFCDLREMDNISHFETTDRSLLQLTRFASAFIDNAEDLWEEGIVKNITEDEENIARFFLNLKSRDIKKMMIPVFRNYILNNL